MKSSRGEVTVMGNVSVLNRKEANENTTAGTFLLDLRNYCKDIDVDSSNNQFNFTGLSGFRSNNFVLESTVSGRLVVSCLWLYVRLSNSEVSLWNIISSLNSLSVQGKKRNTVVHVVVSMMWERLFWLGVNYMPFDRMLSMDSTEFGE